MSDDKKKIPQELGVYAVTLSYILWLCKEHSHEIDPMTQHALNTVIGFLYSKIAIQEGDFDATYH